jgi:hypothetical protein
MQFAAKEHPVSQRDGNMHKLMTPWLQVRHGSSLIYLTLLSSLTHFALYRGVAVVFSALQMAKNHSNCELRFDSELPQLRRSVWKFCVWSHLLVLQQIPEIAHIINAHSLYMLPPCYGILVNIHEIIWRHTPENRNRSTSFIVNSVKLMQKEYVATCRMYCLIY